MFTTHLEEMDAKFEIGTMERMNETEYPDEEKSNLPDKNWKTRTMKSENTVVIMNT
jgi:uncharacterized cupin superfamily protein